MKEGNMPLNPDRPGFITRLIRQLRPPTSSQEGNNYSLLPRKELCAQGWIWTVEAEDNPVYVNQDGTKFVRHESTLGVHFHQILERVDSCRRVWRVGGHKNGSACPDMRGVDRHGEYILARNFRDLID